MSRPPRPLSSADRARRVPDAALRQDALLALQVRLAQEELGMPPGDPAADPASALMDLSATLGALLGLYQRHHEREAALHLARTPAALAAHAGALGGALDPGLTAVGHLVLVPKPGVRGTVSAGLPVAAPARDGLPLRGYETLDTLWVDADLHDLRPLPGSTALPGADTVDLPPAAAGLTPGRLIALRPRAEGSAEPAAIARVAELSPIPGGVRVSYARLDGTCALAPDALAVDGNVVVLAYGEQRAEVLGDSDGRTPRQRYRLKSGPLSWLATGLGAEPALELRCGGRAWTRVAHLGASGPDDRCFVLRQDGDGVHWVQFGDGQRGAVPPAGRLSVSYRVGVGTVGHAPAGAVVRMVQQSPLLRRVTNPVAVRGGADPASPADVRRQATRQIKTFDRAVSVDDHATLALGFPGVARARATWVAGEGLSLVVATAAGETPADLASLRTWLDARRDTSRPMRLGGPVIVDLALDLAIVPAPGVLPGQAQDAARAALHGPDGVFSFAAQELGAAFPLSQLYQTLQAISELQTVVVCRYALPPSDAVADLLRPGPGGWLRLQPAALRFVPLPEGL